MNGSTIGFIILALIAGFAGGFLLANKLNASEMAALRASSGQQNTANSNRSAPNGDTELTNDELKAKIAEADKNPTNLSYQKNLGISLYRYASMKNDRDLLAESIRILTRANSIDPKDADILTSLGNAYFDVGYAKKDLASFQKARELYTKALELKPGDADVRTDLGISYFVQDPPEYEKASVELQKVVTANPKHDRAMQFLIRVYTKQGKVADAEKSLVKLKEISPNDPSIAELTSQVAAAKGSSK